MTHPNDVKSGRGLMPETAAMVDELRAAYGAEVIDRAIAAGQQARRQFLAIEADRGPVAAQAWLARQRFPDGAFWAAEGGREVGVRRP